MYRWEVPASEITGTHWQTSITSRLSHKSHTHTYIRTCITNHRLYIKMEDTSSLYPDKKPKCVWRSLWLFSLVHIPSTNTEKTGYMTYTAATQQVAIEMLWLRFWGAVMSSIFTFSLCNKHATDSKQSLSLIYKGFSHLQNHTQAQCTNQRALIDTLKLQIIQQTSNYKKSQSNV